MERSDGTGLRLNDITIKIFSLSFYNFCNKDPENIKIGEVFWVDTKMQKPVNTAINFVNQENGYYVTDSIVVS